MKLTHCTYENVSLLSIIMQDFDWIEFCAVHVRDFTDTFKYRKFGAEFQTWLIVPIHVLEGCLLEDRRLNGIFFLGAFQMKSKGRVLSYLVNLC